jgi:hypothetical protein
MWGRATASDARGRLGRDDVQVTNKSDKVALLPKLDVLDAMARSYILRRGYESVLRTSSRTSGGDFEELSLAEHGLAA